MTQSTPTFVEVYPNMLGEEYCRLIIDRFEADDRKAPSTVGLTKKRQDPGRTGTSLYIHETMADWQDVVIQTHAAVTKAVTEYAQPFPALLDHLTSGRIGCRYPRIERVEPGQKFEWHADNASTVSADRVLACLLYLSDVNEDGITEFAHQGLTVQPQAGSAAVFPPYWTHWHRGTPPLHETKYTMSFFWTFVDGPPDPPSKLTWRQRLTGRL